MDELSSFFQEVSNKDLQSEESLDNILFISVNEWHINPNDILTWDIPLVNMLLRKRSDFIKASKK